MHELPFPPVQLITGAWRDANELRAHVVAALRGGIRWIQLRAKDRTARELFEAASALAPIVREAGGLFVVNDRVDVAVAAGAAGVHLPENGVAPSDARRLLGPDAWIARSVHSIDAIRAAGNGALDAFQLGPIFETPSKRAFGAPLDADIVREAANVAHARGAALIAVGGITAERAAGCRASGADAISVIGAIWDAADVEHAARAFTRPHSV